MSRARWGVWLCAALAGAAGLGLESVLLSAAGLALGYSRSSALGIGGFVAGWALGAWWAGRSSAPLRRALVASGIASLTASWLVPAGLFAAGRHAPGSALATSIGLGGIVLAAIPQGAFLPLLLRALARRGGERVAAVPGLFAANLLGSVAGAHFLGFVAVGALGRSGSAAIAGAIALLAAMLGAALVPAADSSARAESATARTTNAIEPWRAGTLLAIATAWTIGLEWIVLRLGVLWTGSHQGALTAVLAASLLALALGAAILPALVHRDSRGVLEVLGLAAILSSWPLWASPALAAVSSRGAFATALVLVGPALVPLGAVVPVLHRCLAGDAARRLGGLLLYEAWGAAIGAPLAHWVLVPVLGLGGALAVLGLAAALGALLFIASWPRTSAAVLASSAVVAFVGLRAPEPALASPALANPAFQVRSFAEDSEFAVAVVDDGIQGERTLLTDRFRAAGTGRDYRYMRVLGHLPLLLHPAPRRVAVLALGTGTTVGAVSLHPAPNPDEIDVLEISRAVVEQAPWFVEVNHAALAAGESRVHVRLGDGRRTLAEAPGRYDVITIEPLLPDSPFGVYLYTPEFYSVAARALAPGGLVCQWVPPHALEPDAFAAVVDAFARSFSWSSAWLFGTQVLLLGGEREPVLDARRFPASDDSTPLRTALDELGLATPAGLAARFITDGSRLPRVERPIGDADPWIVFRIKPTDARVFAWLPTNLDLLIGGSSELPEAWRLACGPDGEPLLASVRALHEARAKQARAEFHLRVGRTTIEGTDADLASAIEPLRPARADPEIDQFLREVEFLRRLRSGVRWLQSASSPAADESACRDLLAAAEARPERADVHAYLALALTRLGSRSAAEAAANKARELCPRIAETPEGMRAIALGLDARMLAAKR